jgi:hypothetical protein
LRLALTPTLSRRRERERAACAGTQYDASGAHKKTADDEIVRRKVRRRATEKTWSAERGGGKRAKQSSGRSNNVRWKNQIRIARTCPKRCDGSLECDQEMWIPVFRSITRQAKLKT